MKTSSREHLSGYQARDYEVVDYSMSELEGTGLKFRGPQPSDLDSAPYFTCVGAAQTFGCFCDRPFPDLLAQQLGMAALNLGYGGAGPEFFERKPELDQFINGGQFVVVQVMSGRSQSNSAFDCGGLEIQRRRRDGVTLGAGAAYEELLMGPARLRETFPRPLWRRVAKLLAVPTVHRVVKECRDGWVRKTLAWFDRIQVPIILFWFSQRSPNYSMSARSLSTLFGLFPQLIDEHTLTRVRRPGDHFVDCQSCRGLPQTLISRFTGQPVSVDLSNDRAEFQGVWSHNRYYPSPEMHEDAAAALLPTCRKLIT